MKKFLAISIFFLVTLSENCLADKIIIKSQKVDDEIGNKPKITQQILRIKTFKDGIFDLEEKRGGLAIVSFWAHWCKICKDEMIVLNRIRAAMPKISIIGVSIDEPSEAALAKNVVKNIFYPNALAADILENSFEVPSSVPITYILNVRGEIKRVIEGGFSERDIRKIIEEASRI